MSGATVGSRYLLENLIGRGGMGTVYRAKDRLTGQAVALKQVTSLTSEIPASLVTLSTESASVGLVLAMEFRTMAQLRHPHIVGVLDYGFHTTQPYFTMHLVENARHLTDYAIHNDLPTKIRLLIEMLQALAYLHRRGVIHRDVKPSNVLVSAEGSVKVMDFGLAIYQSKQNTPTEGIVGTLAYMAPELLMEIEASVESDLYAVGIIAYELLSGRHPFAINGEVHIQDILLKQPDMMVLEDNFAPVVARLLAKSPQERYHSADEVIEALCRAANQPVPVESAALRESFLHAAHFTGRDTELKMLKDAVQELFEGRGSAWLIGGESGVGKSRLVDELCIRAMVSGVMVLRGQSIEGGGMVYQSMREPLRRLILDTPLDEFEASVLKEIVPDIERLLNRTIPDAPHIEGGYSGHRLARVIIELFGRQTVPILLVMEDLQWARHSLDLVHKISRTPNLMIVGTYRDDEQPDLPQKLPNMRLIKLSRLDAAAIAELAQSMLGVSAQRPDFLDLLVRETEGNVFFMVETLRVLAEEAGRLADIEHMALPRRVFAGGVQEIVRRRLSRVPAWGEKLLKYAAIIGREIDENVLRVLADASVNLETWITVCSNAAVLEFFENRWRFSHDKLREVLIRDLTDAEHPGLYRLAAETVEEVYPDYRSHSYQLLRLWSGAGNQVKEQQYAILVGDQECEKGRFTEGLQYYTRALKFTTASLTRIDLLMKMGACCTEMGRLDLAEPYFTQALALAHAIGDQRRVILVTYEKHIVALRGGERIDMAQLSDGLKLMRQSGDTRGLARGLWVVGADMIFLRGQPQDSLLYIEECLELSLHVKDYDRIISCYNLLGVAHIFLNQFSTAREYFALGMETARKVGNRKRYFQILANIAEIDRDEGDFEAARLHLESSLDTVLDTDDLIHHTLIMSNLSHVYVALNDFANARLHALRALKLAHHNQLIALRAMIISNFAELRWVMGDIDGALELIGLMTAQTNADANVTMEADRLLEKIRPSADAATIEAVLERGKTLDLEAIVTALLVKFEDE